VRRITVNLLIDYAPDHPYHRASVAALHEAAAKTDIPIELRIVPTDTIDAVENLTGASSAVFIGPGTPYRRPEAANEVIRAARERGVPLVAT